MKSIYHNKVDLKCSYHYNVENVTDNLPMGISHKHQSNHDHLLKLIKSKYWPRLEPRLIVCHLQYNINCKIVEET